MSTFETMINMINMAVHDNEILPFKITLKGEYLEFYSTIYKR